MRRLLRLAVCLTAALIFSVNAYAADGCGHDICCPVLTYHRLTNNPAQTTDWTVTPEKLENDIKQLLDSGYSPIFTSDLVCEDKVIGQVPQNPVIIQFDDGYSSVYELAYPILQKYNIKAEIYIITDYTGITPEEHNGNTFLSWRQLKAMEETGLVYTGLHGKSHLPITSGFSDDEIKSDFKDAWQDIQTNLGQRPHYYVYPSGEFSADTIKLIEQSGGNEQFVWIWDMSRSIKDKTLGRINIGYKTDVLEEIEYYKRLYTALK